MTEQEIRYGNIKFKKSAVGIDFECKNYFTYYAYFKSKRSKYPTSVILENNGFVFEWTKNSSKWYSLGPSGMRVFKTAMNKGLLLEIDMNK